MKDYEVTEVEKLDEVKTVVVDVDGDGIKEEIITDGEFNNLARKAREALND